MNWITKFIKPKIKSLFEKRSAKVDEHLWTITAARLILPAEMVVQAPPNLQPGELGKLIRAGVNDWGGVPRSRLITSIPRHPGRISNNWKRRPKTPVASCASDWPLARCSRAIRRSGWTKPCSHASARQPMHAACHVTAIGTLAREK